MKKSTIRQGLDIIASGDRHIADAVKNLGYPEPRIWEPGFETLLSIIISQQLSSKAADSIKAKVKTLLPALRPDTLLSLEDGSLRQAGLSGRKVEYAMSLARAIVSGQFDPDQLAALDDEPAINRLVELRGFGQWSAEIYLMFCLQRSDIFPANDLALQYALQKLKGLKSRPNSKQSRDIVRHWAPWRSAGSLFLWHFYQNLKRQE